MMELRQDLEKGKATFTAVSEFLLTHPVLSFGVREVAHSRLRHTEVLPAEEESESLTTGALSYTHKYTNTYLHHKKQMAFFTAVVFLSFLLPYNYFHTIYSMFLVMHIFQGLPRTLFAFSCHLVTFSGGHC